MKFWITVQVLAWSALAGVVTLVPLPYGGIVRWTAPVCVLFAAIQVARLIDCIRYGLRLRTPEVPKLAIEEIEKKWPSSATDSNG